MRELSFQIVPGGLALDGSDLDGMTMLRNLKPDGDHWTVPAAFTMPVTAETFPFPQFIQTSKYLFCGGADYLNILNPATMEPVDEYATETGGLWQIADLGDLFVATNGACTVYRIREDDEGDYVLTTTVTEGKQWGACCDYRHGRLIVGNLSGGLDNWVGWGSIGADDLAATLTGGTIPNRIKLRKERMVVRMPGPGAVLAIKPLDPFLIVYCEDGVYAMKQHDQNDWHGFSFETLAVPAGVGAAWRGAMAGDANGHVFIGSDGNVYSIAPDIGVKRLCDGTFIPKTAVVVHDPVEREFWFSGATSAHVMTESGIGGPIDTAPWSLVRIDGESVATGFPYPAELRAQLWTNVLDAGDSSQKRITFVRIAGDGLTAVKAAAAVRYGTSGAYQQTQWKTGSPDGSCFVNAALVTGKVGGLATVSPGSRVWRVEVRYQSHDRRFVRGTRGVTKQED